MTPTARWSILSLALAAAGGLGALSSKEKPPEERKRFAGQAGETQRSRSAVAWEASAAEMDDRPVKPAPVWRGQSATARGADGIQASFPGASGTQGMATSRQGEDGVSQDEGMLVSRDELEWRALKVEQEASKKLKNLLQVLDLPEEKQDRIFVALAKNSEYYHPLLRFQGPSGGDLTPAPVKPPPAAPEPEAPGAEKPAPQPEPPAPETPAEDRDPVLDELTPEERQAYERAEAEREEFWSGVIEEVEAQLDASGSP